MSGNGCNHANTRNETRVENGRRVLVTVCTASGCGAETARSDLGPANDD